MVYILQKGLILLCRCRLNIFMIGMIYLKHLGRPERALGKHVISFLVRYHPLAIPVNIIKIKMRMTEAPHSHRFTLPAVFIAKIGDETRSNFAGPILRLVHSVVNC